MPIYSIHSRFMICMQVLKQNNKCLQIYSEPYAECRRKNGAKAKTG